MIYPLIKATHYIGLVTLLGGPAFWYLIWWPAKRAAEPKRWQPGDEFFVKIVRTFMLSGFVLFFFSGLLDIMRSTIEFYGFIEWEFFVHMATETEMGKVILARLAAAVLFLIPGLRLAKQSKSMAWLAPLITGFLVIASISVLSHQAGKESPFPLIADMVHLTATTLWAGGLIYFCVVPRSMLQTTEEGRRRFAEIGNVFSTLGLLAVVGLTVTGVYISLQQFHSTAALTGTTYGMYLLRKVAAFGVVIAVAAFHHYLFVPRLNATLKQPKEADRTGRRFLTLVRVETLVMIVILLAAGFLTTQMPPQRPVGLAEVADKSGTFGDNEYHLVILPRDGGQLLFELTVEDADGSPVTLDWAELDLTMTQHYMPPYILRMDEEQPGLYRSTGILSMGGLWQVTLTLRWDGDETHETVIEFNTRASLRDSQQEKQYAWSALWEKRFGIVLFLLFTAITCVGGYALIRGLRPPRELLLSVLGVLLFLGGAFQMARVAEVPGPYTFRFNKVRRTAEVVARAGELYQAHCLLCHGIEGRGDGPAADSLNPKPADFTSTHIRQHADGELFWWISKGIRGTSMPAFEKMLTERERWMLVHYLRILSGEVPPPK